MGLEYNSPLLAGSFLRVQYMFLNLSSKDSFPYYKIERFSNHPYIQNNFQGSKKMSLSYFLLLICLIFYMKLQMKKK